MPERLHIPDLPGCLPWVHEEGRREPVAFGPGSIIEPEALFSGVERPADAEARIKLAPYLPRLVAPLKHTAETLDMTSCVAEHLPATAMTTLFTEHYGLDLTDALEEGTGQYRMFCSTMSNRDGRDLELVYQVQPKPPHYAISLIKMIVSARRGFVHMRDGLVGPLVVTGEGNVMKVPGVAPALRTDVAAMRKAILTEKHRRTQHANQVVQ
jgi:hypothetical protein